MLSTTDSISITLYTALAHLDKRNTYVRKRFVDYSSAFNTIVPSKIITKLRTLELNTSLCNWILDFLMGHTQAPSVGNNTSALMTIKMGAPQGCGLRLLLYSLFNHNCIVAHDSNTIIKLAEDTKVARQITDEPAYTAYREEVRYLEVWCQDNNFSLNVRKKK